MVHGDVNGQWSMVSGQEWHGRLPLRRSRPPGQPGQRPNCKFGGRRLRFSFRRGKSVAVLPRGNAMRLSEILKPQNIKLPLEARTKSEAIKELVDLLAGNQEI